MKYAKIFVGVVATALGSIIVYEAYQFVIMFIGNVMHNYDFMKNFCEYFSG